jgi:hypothetical protein
VSADTFEAIAREWLDARRKKFAPKTLKKAEWTFGDLLFPYIGSRPIRQITAPEILEVVRKLERLLNSNSAHRSSRGLTTVAVRPKTAGTSGIGVVCHAHFAMDAPCLTVVDLSC